MSGTVPDDARKLTTHADLRVETGHFEIEYRCGSSRERVTLDDLAALVVLEIFVVPQSTEAAWSTFRGFAQKVPPKSVVAAVGRLRRDGVMEAGSCRVALGERRLFVSGERQGNYKRGIDLSLLSSALPQILRALGQHIGVSDNLSEYASPDAFAGLVERLVGRGLLVPPRGQIAWGDLRRLAPFCTHFGRSRGQEIDRYYLERFVAAIRELVVGEVLEVGGELRNREAYGFERATAYHALDLYRPDNAEVDIIGDVLDPGVVAPGSFDGIVLFNVLEHCPRPWQAIENLARWLRPGGLALCAVPSTQRLHGFPSDYWRPSPAALEHLFGDWSERRLWVYGNPLTAVACLLGVSADELSASELDAVHPDYPVLSCIVARK